MSREQSLILNIFIWDWYEVAEYCRFRLQMVDGRRCHCFLAMLQPVARVILVTVSKVRTVVKESIYRSHAM